ncbi:MAG: DUF305 domain-containing protein [Chloroflexi bacterium]|nr:DUF305 domain-containing protein [Chloroflexota bacterium]
MKRWLVALAAVAALVVGTTWWLTPARAQTLDTLGGEEFEKAFLREMIMHHAMAVMMAQPIPERAVHDELKAVGRSIITSQTAEIEQMRTWLRDWYGIDQPMPMMQPGQGMGSGMGQGGHMMPGMHESMHGAGNQGMMPGQGQGMMPGMGQGQTPGQGSGMPMDQCSGMGMEMMGMITGLAGPRLEATFMAMMIPHHEGAITMARLAAERATHEELRTLARKIVEDQSGEIQSFNQWLAAWYNL